MFDRATVSVTCRVVVPGIIPRNDRQPLLIAFHSPRAILLADHSRTVLLDVRDHREQIGLDVEAAAGDTSKIDLIWVPGEGSSTGNVTGGRKFARHHFVTQPFMALVRASADKPTSIASGSIQWLVAIMGSLTNR